MNVVNVTSINVLDNPCAFGNPFQFEITFECLQELKDDLDWKIIYVGSAESELRPEFCQWYAHSFQTSQNS